MRESVRPRSIIVAALAAAWLLAGAASLADDAPDAVVERWEPSWTWKADGSMVFEETRHVRLMHERAYGEFADPRITFHRGDDALEVLTARTRLPDGSTLDVPGYSRNEVSPGATAGWPAYADLRQLVLTMSGIQPGCVVETAYRITSRPGSHPALVIELPLDQRYPIQAATITLTLPDSVRPQAALLNVEKDRCSDSASADPGARTIVHRWALKNVPASIDEPQSPPWRLWRPRLVVSTLPDEAWQRQRLARVEAAAAPAERVAELAGQWTRAASVEDRVRDLQGRLAATFNFVEFEPAWRRQRVRPAADVLRDNYGLPEEAAAGLLALARAAGLTAEAVLVVAPDLVESAAASLPRHGFVAADYAVGVWDAAGGGRSFWHPQHGQIGPDARWAGAALLVAHADGTDAVLFDAPTSAESNALAFRGKVSLSADGRYSGHVALSATGAFVSAEALRAAAAQRTRIEGLLRRVLPDVAVDRFTVTQLAAGRFEADVDVSLGRPLEKLDEAWRLVTAGEPPSGLDVPMPLADAPRRSPLRLAAAFTELVDLTIEWPTPWRTLAVPRECRQSGAWGEAGQRVTAGATSCRVERTIRAARRDLPAAEFVALRAAVNACRTEAARTILIRP